jgi:hypothetical protein
MRAIVHGGRRVEQGSEVVAGRHEIAMSRLSRFSCIERCKRPAALTSRSRQEIFDMRSVWKAAVAPLIVAASAALSVARYTFQLHHVST